MANRTQSTSTTVFALDEMYGIAPIPDLPNMLSEGGSQGVIVAGAVQDLALIKDRWRQAGESFLTLFQDVLVFPGIRHGETLDVVSTLIGDYDRPVPQTTTGGGPQGANWSETTNIQRQRRMPPDAVYAGPDPGNQDVLLHLSSQGTGQLFATPYWRASPWPQVITDCMELALGGGESMWAQYVRMMGGTPDEPPLTDLPIPDLTSWANRHAAAIPGRSDTSPRSSGGTGGSSAPPHAEDGEGGDEEDHEEESPDERDRAAIHHGRHQRREAEDHDDGHEASHAPRAVTFGVVLRAAGRRREVRRGRLAEWHHWRLPRRFVLVVLAHVRPHSPSMRPWRREHGMRIRRPIRRCGMSPRLTASYANDRLMPSSAAASSTVNVSRPAHGSSPLTACREVTARARGRDHGRAAGTAATGPPCAAAGARRGRSMCLVFLVVARVVG